MKAFFAPLLLFALCGVLGAACESAPADTVEFTPAVAPMIGTNEDGADRDCRIVLLDLARPSNNTGGWETLGSTWVWRGHIDVRTSELDEGARPAVLFHYGSDPTWWEAELQPAEGALAGFSRFAFALYDHVPSPGMSGTSLTRAVVEVIPVLTRGDHRLFDHNRNPGEWDNYVLNLNNGFLIPWDAGVCSLVPQAPVIDPLAAAPRATISFPAAGSPELTGRLVAGGVVTVVYEPERMTTCRDTHNGYPAWDLRAFVKFNPSGVVLDQSVRSFVTNNGTPTTTAFALPADFIIPADTTSLELWFWNSGIGGGYACQDYDSQAGANYPYAVFPAPGWIGGAKIMLSRSASQLCQSDAPDYNGPFSFGSWERTRTTFTSLCFEVWQEGVTDLANPNLWQDLDVQVHYRYAGQEAFATEYVSLFDQVGNNARYGLDLRPLDPFAMYYCPDVPTTEYTSASGEQMVQSPIEFYFTVNGAIFVPENALFGGNYQDYAASSFRDENCQ
ncbi:hypothetical protein KKD52_11545 [Myxococcota bacterium]|nr:hypothetical protein [Myxococcota bacterium]MBU1510987.1 hypothetical protein [Myxococcota bacterium]